MGTDIKNMFTMHISEKHAMKFTHVSLGLHLFDTRNVDMSKIRNACSFLNTGVGNKKLLRARDIHKVDDTIRLNCRTNQIAKDKKFTWIVSENKITNNPITVGDVNQSKLIYAPPPLPPIKGRTRDQESQCMNDIIVVQLPKAL